MSTRSAWPTPSTKSIQRWDSLPMNTLLLMGTALILMSFVESKPDRDPLAAILAPDSKVEKLQGGFQFTEGPVWHPEGYLLFSDIPVDTIYRWEPGGISK